MVSLFETLDLKKTVTRVHRAQLPADADEQSQADLRHAEDEGSV